MKHLAVVGSSGGNLYNQGGSDPKKMMGEIFTQAKSAGIEVSYIQFIGTSTTMDNISMDAKARLWTLAGESEVQCSEEDTLANINEMAKSNDEELARLIREDKIDGIMLMSCDPSGANHEALTAAAEKKIPVAGTGGTSMATTQSMGCNVIAASGTTGTTNRTRAISAISAFSKEWKIKYSPIIGSSSGAAVQEGSVWKRINFRGIMMASMPGFIAMALCLALSKIPGLGGLEDLFNLLIETLPIILAAIAAKQVSGLDEVGIVAGIVAGALSKDGGIIGGLVVGIIGGVLAYYIIQFCFRHKVPGTTANIAAGGISGLVAGLIGMYAIAPVAAMVGDGIKMAIDWAIDFNGILAGGIAGFAIWFAILGGVYHAAILPIILLEMEASGFSFLGAVDLCGLIMVCAGLQLANVIYPKKSSDRVASIPNLIINLAFGTFAEAAYPYMFSSKKVFAATIGSSTIAGILIGLFDVKCTAYVPCFMAPLMSNNTAVQTVICMVVSVLVPCVLTILCNKIDKAKEIEA
ncbi:MAG: PTS sugar transporter [Lachnospiraceae bacterium]|nr:PTS sugar transporter [Lachnospiraceae bacterium]